MLDETIEKHKINKCKLKITLNLHVAVKLLTGSKTGAKVTAVGTGVGATQATDTVFPHPLSNTSAPN